jgi:uncharacterized protein YfbU (UPF0304 family)
MQLPKKCARFDLRLDAATIATVDVWRASQVDHLSRQEAVRRLIQKGLVLPSCVRLGDGEKIIALMLGELIQKLNFPTDIDPAFVRMAIVGGHDWAFGLRYPHLFSSPNYSHAIFPEVVSILDMWSFLEEGIEHLGDAGRADVTRKTLLAGDVGFRGFDGHTETGHMSVAAFLIDELGQFRRFKDRAWLDSQTLALTSYRHMLKRFLPIKQKLDGRSLTSCEIALIVSAG